MVYQTSVVAWYIQCKTSFLLRNYFLFTWIDMSDLANYFYSNFGTIGAQLLRLAESYNVVVLLVYEL